MIRSLTVPAHRYLARGLACALVLLLAACGQSQNWPPRVLPSPPGTLALSAATYAVGQATGSVTVTVTRTGGTGGAVAVNFATKDGSAAAGTDYTAVSGTLAWGASDAAPKTFVVPLNTDAPFSGTRAFSVQLSAATGGATIGTPSTATVTISGAAPAQPGTLSVASATYSVAQAAGTLAIQVTRAGGSAGAVAVHYATSDNVARAGVDYTAASGTLNWADGDAASKTITIAIATATPFAGARDFTVTLSAPSGGATLGTPAAAAVTITGSVSALRPLPSVYQTGRAIAYSAYRAGGPGAGEVVSDANILEDLTLLYNNGYRLLRLFGADVNAANILRVALAHFPTLQFQLGIYLEGAPQSCTDSVNATGIATAISLANQYPGTVATVSVGNETSFANNLPVSCLAGYITEVRAKVTQPVTADDDYTFFAGRTASGEKPDTILPLLDFVSIHTYPFSNTGLWNWQQTAVTAGPARAQAMMEAALANAQATYAEVANYAYHNAAGQSVTIGATLPIVIGETGWKAVQTNPSSQLEAFAANPVNAKWYLDLLNTWGGTAGGPVTIFYFEAFDEAWKGQDDGWGLWTAQRQPLYALCGTPAGTACNADLYQGAGYYH